jgi:serine/threonine-protein kinase HipA
VLYPQISLERDLAIGVGSNGRQATLKNALSEAASFGFSKSEAIALALDIQKTVKANREGVFNNSGITAPELERLRNCFIACDEPIQQVDGEAI